MILYNLTHDFVNLRLMLKEGSREKIGFVSRFVSALWRTITGDLAAFYTGEIDDFKREAVGVGSWIHAAIGMIAVVGLLYRQRGGIVRVVRNFSLRGSESGTIPLALIPPMFIIIYMVIYCSAKFSLKPFSTPRYFLPLCPFMSVTIALFLLWKQKNVARKLGIAVWLFLMLRGAVISTEFGVRPCHEEHRIKTCGAEIEKLARFFVINNIRTAWAPYEIQWRLMFETDEQLIAASRLFSPLIRYPHYLREIRSRILDGERFALVFRKDFAFVRMFAPEGVARNNEIILGKLRLNPSVLRNKAISCGEEFVVFYPLTVSKEGGKLVIR